MQSENLNANWIDQLACQVLFSKLKIISHGYLQIYFADRVYEFGNENMQKALHAVIRVHDARVFRNILLGGEPAAGKTYLQGMWSSDNLIDVMRLFTLNRDALFSFKCGIGSIAKFVYWITNRKNKNTKKGARQNIQAHYDIGNDFYRLFLDKRMMYSSAYFEHSEYDLEIASEQKLKLICEKLDLSRNDNVIEIGSGWGGFAVYAAQNYGCHVTTTTISDEQFKHVKALVDMHKLDNKITVLKSDYRNLNGKFDKLVSIEMIESIGHEYFDTYFSKCSNLLKEDGIMLIQAITISDYLYHKYIRSADFIRQYIFPGGCLPSTSAMFESVARSTDLTIFYVEGFASSYAKTLDIWYQRFIENKEKVKELGYPKSLLRLWEYYLKYCQAGFEERVIDVHHIVLKKPYNRKYAIN